MSSDDRTGPQAHPSVTGSVFAGLLASSIHDMKNSLGIVLGTLDDLVESDLTGAGRDRVAGLQQETRRVREHLVQLLALYRMEHSGFAPNICEQSVEAFLEDCLLRDKPMMDARGLEGELDCRADLYWCFDPDLVAGVIGNAMHNAARYARGRLMLAAEVRDGWLRVSVNDDGEGVPAAMTGAAVDGPAAIDFSSGSTGLGLCFSANAAALHGAAGRRGHVRLENGGALGGGLFVLCLP